MFPVYLRKPNVVITRIEKNDLYLKSYLKQTTVANRLVYDIQVQNICSAEIYNEIYNMDNKRNGHNIIKQSLCKIINPEYEHCENINIDEYLDSTKTNKYTYKETL